jgi:NAD(P)-dependent dehydrogenase (short-subunit alcohol dehydrogenase family)
MKLVVTGCSSGIGRAVALKARAAGWDVLASVREADHANALEQQGCATASLELRDAASIERFAVEVTQWCEERLDALVNSAGVAFPGPVEELRMDHVREQFEVNVFGHVDLTQRLLPSVRAARGRIVFISSDRASAPVPLYGAYVASKRALNGFADVLASEVEALGVGVSVLELGAYDSNIRTAIRKRLDEHDRAGSPYAALVTHMKARLGQPPLGDPEDAAAAVLALLT